MNCRTCGYALWNLRERTCPECGNGFQPSEFKFVLNSVRFCCPHCSQDYYGTGEHGHLVPRAFQCVRCAASIEMDQMVLLPTAGVLEESTRAVVMPWLERSAQAGWFGKRWFMTVLMVLGSPGRLMQALPRHSSPWAAVGFAYLCYGVYVLLGGSFLMLFLLPALLIGGGIAAAMALLGIVVGIGILPLLVIGVWAALAHTILRLTGPTQLGYGRTFEALAYSSATNLIAAVPCVGAYITPVAWGWWVVSGTVMVKDGQRVSGLRATAAVGTPAGIAVAAVVAVLFGVLVPAVQTNIAQAGAAAAQAGTLNEIRAQSIMSGLSKGAALEGEWPHAAELIADGSIPAFYCRTGGEVTTDVSIAGESLDDLAILPDSEREASLTTMRAGLPASATAYRLADYVFTYPGIPTRDADGELWLFVAEDRLPGLAFGQPSAQPGTRIFIVGKADRSIVRMTGEALAAALPEQNTRRVAAGLGEIPHPDNVESFWPSAADR